MAATTRPRELTRFDQVERVVHWINAALFMTLVATGAILYLDALQRLVGRRALIEDIHLASGLALPVPFAAALAGRWGAGLRRDLRRFNRWTRHDILWFRSLFKDRANRAALQNLVQLGKFNPGQKLNAAFIAGAGLVMLGTGVIMKWYHPWPLSWRTGATFVHDWLALSIGVVIIGHVGMALRDPDALRAMWSGRISRRWAESHAPAWLAEQADEVNALHQP
ncbi:MAG: cytochrome b/b6 domain-containing protein [Acidimicrobiales bacterium]|nr:cytochrome b/b6 domain-containing protein [Acidimicrobiales bacterium]